MELNEEMKEYYAYLEEGLKKAYNYAKEARSKGLDPSKDIEIKISRDLASRVEALVGPKGITKYIEEMEEKNLDPVEMAFRAIDVVLEKFSAGNKEKDLEQSVRTAVAILTEGVLVAPTEGIAKVRIHKDNYAEIYFTGPIRSAGGTAAAMAVVFTDYARKKLGIGEYKATPREVERYVEEVDLYEHRAAHLQYKPSDDKLRFLIKNCPVCINGEPTEQIEVSVNRDLPRVHTNRVRGGVALVTCEGIAQKAAKLLKYSKKYNLGWEWVGEIAPIKTKSKSSNKIEKNYKYLEGMVVGRPVFSYPMEKGGFRVRYGRSRTNGLMAKSIHPATMYLLDEFIAIGTHVKVERPGKGAVLTPCDTIEPPIVKLKNGSVKKIRTTEEAKKLFNDIEEIIFLGDMLITYGDFSKSNNPLLPSGWCEEWFDAILEEKNIEKRKFNDIKEAIEFSKKYKVPLHPKYTLFWSDISKEDLFLLRDFLKNNNINELPITKEKRILEILGVEHEVKDNKIYISEFYREILIETLKLNEEKEIKGEDVLEILRNLVGIEIKPFAPFYIGARMGRPEKAAERKMKGSVNGLFPTGNDNQRSLMKLYKVAKTTSEKNIYPELAIFKCPVCGARTYYNKCHKCGNEAILLRKCQVCGKYVKDEIHCGKKTISYERTPIKIVELIDKTKQKLGFLPKELKGVKGITSELKIPERIEKLFYRAKHEVYVFKDGTSRFDATDTPLTHFKPKEIHLSVEKAKELGYTKDYKGNPLVSEDQILVLKPQDFILSKHGLEYFYRVASFVDDMLVGLYGMKPYYNLKKPLDLIGHLFLAMAPHTSNSVLVRLIGYTEANVGFGHPYFHTSKRRNCDGDEDAVFLLLDAFINFSKSFTNSSRGATMDLPITLSVIIDPKEVDDEVYEMEIVDKYPLEFYEKAEKFAMPGEIKIKTVKDILGTKEQFGSFGLSHDTTSINDGPKRTKYVQLDSVPSKIEAQFNLYKKIRAVDPKDAAEKLILGHFIPDIYGNLRSFSRQTFRCTSCNTIYRRPPLKGRCLKCGGNLILTINQGGIKKYLDISLSLIENYELDEYLKQRLLLVKKELELIFNDEKKKQMGLADFF